MTQPGEMLHRLDATALSNPQRPQATSAASLQRSDSFAELLQLAREGKVQSNLPVDVSPSLDLELSEEDAARVAFAVDKAQAAGADSALVLLDGQGLLVDVPARRIEAVVQKPGEVLAGIEAVVVAPNPDGTVDEEQVDAARLLFPGVISNPSLQTLLARDTVHPPGDNRNAG